MKRCTALKCALVGVALAASRAAADPVRYSRDIRPILAEHCFACHGPDGTARKAKLRLDVRDVAVAREAIVPGKPDESNLVARVFAADPRRGHAAPEDKEATDRPAEGNAPALDRRRGRIRDALGV